MQIASSYDPDGASIADERTVSHRVPLRGQSGSTGRALRITPRRTHSLRSHTSRSDVALPEDASTQCDEPRNLLFNRTWRAEVEVQPILCSLRLGNPYKPHVRTAPASGFHAGTSNALSCRRPVCALHPRLTPPRPLNSERCWKPRQRRLGLLFLSESPRTFGQPVSGLT